MTYFSATSGRGQGSPSVIEVSSPWRRSLPCAAPIRMASHMRRALDNGLTKEELAEAITHLAFYAGWPAAMTAVRTAKSLFDVPPNQPRA
jgi:carboxymuconolactone decarboxylase family protein